MRFMAIIRRVGVRAVAGIALLWAAGGGAGGSAWAQQMSAGPQVGYVYPAGCRQGTSTTVIVGGRQLKGVAEVLFSGSGLTARVIAHDRPLANEERVKLRDELVMLRRQTTPPPSAERIAELEKNLATVPRNDATPALQETVTLEVSAAADAPLGQRDLRLLSRAGLSLPLTFMVGDLPEVSFPAVSATTLRAPAGSARAATESAGAEIAVTLPTVVNGQILPGESDRIRFAAKKGQRLIVAVHARALVPYLADAVPGWFQAAATLLDAKGRELAYADDFRFQPDPVLAFRIPVDGDYTLVLRDALYRGREDFGYRVAIGELPFVSGFFPLGGKAGTELDFALNGWNLPAPKRHARLPAGTGFYALDLGRCAAATGLVEVAVDDLPECGENEPNDKPREARKIVLPVVVNGRIAEAGDADWVEFEGKAGAQIVLDVAARRLRSPLDGTLQVLGPDGGVLASNDDSDDKADGLTTHHADPHLVFTPKTDGVFRACLTDVQHRGGYDYNYRLRVGAPRPDFALRVVPSSVNLRPGAGAKVTVYALRQDGFAGEIVLALRGAPTGFRLSDARIPAGEDKVETTLNATREVAGETAALELDGTARIGDAEVKRAAVAADDRMQAFFYRHLVPAQEWRVAVRRNGK
jgi:hypothetical protein